MDQTLRFIADFRRLHPTWGAKKLIRILSRRRPDWNRPSRSTCSDLLLRHGLVNSKKRRTYPGHPGRPLTPMDEPNAIWTADFKGQFRTRDGQYCYPLTIVDGFSRDLLACQGLRSTAVRLSKPVFKRLFEEFGRPHEALDQETPASVYRASSRTLPRELPRIEYRGHFAVRLVSENSGIRWKSSWVCVTHTLAGEYVGLEEVDDELRDVYFGPVKLGRMDESKLRIEDHKGRWVRKTASPMSPD